MPWCPKCKTEYKKGVIVCVDCGSELVDEQPEMYEYSKLCTLEKEEVAKKLIKYFEFSNIYSHYNYEEAELGYVVYVRDDEMKQAKKAFHAFYTVEAEHMIQEEAKTCNAKEDSKDDSSTDEFENEAEIDTSDAADSAMSDDLDGISEEEVEMLKDHAKVSKIIYGGSPYEKKSDKLKDLKSTAATFFLFSIAGIIVVGLNMLGVINFIGGTLQYCLLIALFIGFFVIGINSLQRMKKVSQEAVIEEENTKKITEWLNSHITEETLNEFKDSSLSNEANFIHVMEGIKQLVIKEFGTLDDSYLDYITEEFYNEKFGEEDE
ncbi:MAG: hypothetical protein PUC65_04735 [Clostridiales bacterium]|nr:hypothetical protein [Clostridiales bacterium]